MAKVTIDGDQDPPLLKCTFQFGDLDDWERKFISHTKLEPGREIKLVNKKEKKEFTEAEKLTLRDLYRRYDNADIMIFRVSHPDNKE